MVSFDLPLSFEIQPVSLSVNTRLYINREYVTLIRRGFPANQGPEEQYLYLRSLYHLQDWNTLAELTPKFPSSSFLFPYVLFYRIQAHARKKNWEEAWTLFQQNLAILKEVPYPEEISDTKEQILAGLNLERESQNLGRFFYFRYLQKKDPEDFRKSIEKLDTRALELLTLKNYKKYIDSEQSFKIAGALSKKSALAAQLYLDANALHEAGKIYFNQKNYSKALEFLQPQSLEASLCRLALNQSKPEDYTLALENRELSFEFLMKNYLENRQTAKMLELLRQLYQPGWLRESVITLAQEKNFTNLKPLLIQAATLPLTDEELSMVFYYLGYVLALENRAGESASFLKEAALRFPGEFYGSQAFRLLNAKDRRTVLKEQKNLFHQNLKILRQELAAFNQRKFPSSAERGLFFLKIEEFEKGYLELRNALGDLNPYYLSLLKFHKSLGKTSSAIYFASLFYQNLNQKTRNRLVYKNLFAELFPLKYQQTVRDAGNYYQVAPEVLMALIRQESRFDEKARSWVGAQGLMQLMPNTARPILKALKKKGKIRRANIYNPEVNILTGTAYFKWLYHQVYPAYPAPFREILSIASYNAGPGRIKKHFDAFKETPDQALFIESIPLEETREYVKRVLLYRDFYLYLYPSFHR